MGPISYMTGYSIVISYRVAKKIIWIKAGKKPSTRLPRYGGGAFSKRDFSSVSYSFIEDLFIDDKNRHFIDANHSALMAKLAHFFIFTQVDKLAWSAKSIS